MRWFPIKEYDVTLRYNDVIICIEGVKTKTRIGAIGEAFRRSGFDKKKWVVCGIGRIA